jgi:integrase
MGPLVQRCWPPTWWVVMEILGHSQIALTMNTYSHVAPEVSREAADRIAQMLWQIADDGSDHEDDSQ